MKTPTQIAEEARREISSRALPRTHRNELNAEVTDAIIQSAIEEATGYREQEHEKTLSTLRIVSRERDELAAKCEEWSVIFADKCNQVPRAAQAGEDDLGKSACGTPWREVE